jgi:formylglycine-generating enzyme
MKNTLKTFIIFGIALMIFSCNKLPSNKSSLTGFIFNDKKYGNFVKGNIQNYQKPPLGMVLIEGGSFTMGRVQDDVMFDWNTTPKKNQVNSFFMDEAEVTNIEYSLYVQYIKDVFPPSEEKYKYIYSSVLPDTLSWGGTLTNPGTLHEEYFRNPAYADYPVVGVSWLQANEYCKWRTNLINLKTLIDRGYIKNIFEKDSISNFFDTEVFLADNTKLFNGDSTIYKKGAPVRNNLKRRENRKQNNSFKGRKINKGDGILIHRFRLPTEAEWEYAAKFNIQDREYNIIRGRKKYPWKEKYTRSSQKKYKGDQLANFKQGLGDYSGVPGWSSDGAAIPNKVKSYPPNGFGLYDMSGNVSEWVADVYRPIIDNQANDFNYFRGNIFHKKMIDPDGNLVYAANNEKEITIYDTLPNGKIKPRDLPGLIKVIPITKDDAIYRANYALYNNTNIGDGDMKSSRFFYVNEDEFASKASMYNSPKGPTRKRDAITGKDILVNDAKNRTTLISDNTRVYKGGSWSDREYWLDPAQRRYLPEYMATNYIGFRCVSDKLGPMSTSKKTARNPSR